MVVATDTGDILVIEGTELKLTLSSGLEGAALHCMVHYQKVHHAPCCPVPDAQQRPWHYLHEKSRARESLGRDRLHGRV